MAIKGCEWTTGAIVPHLAVRDVDEAVDFYKRAFDAEELYRSPVTPEFGEYVSLKIWSSIVMVSGGSSADPHDKPELSFIATPDRLGGTTCVLQICVPDADRVYDRSVQEGALPAMPLADMFWGDRYGWVRDPFGHLWAICCVNEILTAEENERRMVGAR
jgi:PhnB protein